MIASGMYFYFFYFIHSVAPVIDASLVDQNITVFVHLNNATFVCNATGYPQPEIQWVRDGSAILDSEHYQITSASLPENCSIITGCQTSSSLLVIGTKIQDIGKYTCIANNTAGNDTRMAELTVNSMFNIFYICIVFYFLQYLYYLLLTRHHKVLISHKL